MHYLNGHNSPDHKPHEPRGDHDTYQPDEPRKRPCSKRLATTPITWCLLDENHAGDCSALPLDITSAIT